jgi:hypothetical protein
MCEQHLNFDQHAGVPEVVGLEARVAARGVGESVEGGSRAVLTETLGYPKAVQERLKQQLPAHIGERPVVRVTPLFEGRRAAAWTADCYEVASYYVYTSPELPRGLEAALAALAEVYRTCVVTDGVLPPDWPTMGRRRSSPELRVHARALMR